MPTGYHKIGVGAGIVALLQTLTLSLVSFVMLYVSTYIFGIRMTEEHSAQYLALGLIALIDVALDGVHAGITHNRSRYSRGARQHNCVPAPLSRPSIILIP